MDKLVAISLLVQLGIAAAIASALVRSKEFKALLFLPARPAMVQHEWMAMPVCVLAGVLAGALRRIAPSDEDIWSFTPFVDLSIYRWFRRNFPRPTVDWQIALLTLILA